MIYPQENIDCLSSLSFTAFSLSSLSFSDCYFVFLLFLFVIYALLFLFWTPSAKSWLSRMQGSVVLIFVFSWCYVFICVIYPSKVVFHPFIVAFVVRPIICSISQCLRALLPLHFLSMPLTLNSPQLLSLYSFEKKFLKASYSEQTINKNISVCLRSFWCLQIRILTIFQAASIQPIY